MSRIRFFSAAVTTCAVVSYAIAPSTALAQRETPSPTTLLARVSERYRSAQTVRIRFEQSLVNPMTGSTAKARGELIRKHPNLFSVTFTEPASDDRIVSDGRWIWLYLPSSAPNQVIRMPVEDGQAAWSDPISQILTAPTERYSVASAGTATIGGKASYGVVLAPKQRDPRLTKATIWVDQTDGTLRGIDVMESSGIERKVVILKMETNVSLPRSAFVFTPPAKARIIDQRAMLGG